MKTTSTLLPRHAEALQKWKHLAGEVAATGTIVANISDSFTLKDCRAISWKHSPEMFLEE